MIIFHGLNSLIWWDTFIYITHWHLALIERKANICVGHLDHRHCHISLHRVVCVTWHYWNMGLHKIQSQMDQRLWMGIQFLLWGTLLWAFQATDIPIPGSISISIRLQIIAWTQVWTHTNVPRQRSLSILLLQTSNKLTHNFFHKASYFMLCWYSIEPAFNLWIHVQLHFK